jgi:hypothetical protein
VTNVLERARRARSHSRDIRAESLLRAADAHQRAAAIARNVATMLPVASGYPTGAERAREHELAALVLRRRARWIIHLRLTDIEINVHLGFPSAAFRADVLALLHGLGPWEGGELVDTPGRGVYFRIASDDPVMSEVAVRERIRCALTGLQDWEQLISFHTVWPERL